MRPLSADESATDLWFSNSAHAPTKGYSMAKALFGHVSATDPRVTARLAAENRRLQQRVADLEAEILRLQSQNDALVAAAVKVLDDSMQPA